MSSQPSTIGGNARIRVGLDHWIFTDQHRGGISRYFAGMVGHMPEFGVDPKVLAPLYINDSLRSAPKDLVWGRPLPWSRRNQVISKAVGRTLAVPLARMTGAQVVHETYFSSTRTAPKKVPVVLTMYDMIHEIYPGHFHPDDSTVTNKPISIARADWIICISEQTRRDLIRFYPQAEAKSSVVYFGFDQRFQPDPSRPRLHERPYILYVGVRRKYKNFLGLLSGYAQSRLPQEAIDLVCIGGGEFEAKEREAIERSGVSRMVHRLEASDEALQSWYQHALLFAYPSLYEGFGIPPLEAMAADCPVVAVRAGPVPEVCGDAAQFAEPDAPETMVQALEAVALSPERAADLRLRGREQIGKFSWRKCAAETCNVYKSLV
jgi:glycosyltransferase involved in cell wall biosynthesis